ncbi:MAG TPA: HAMP domain-containing histidine kinase, partial [Candidatus Atribacteria bacterium]|nr:HAMP domain-containing histidine kinase [Candidatus Atribacteria bacterium]
EVLLDEEISESQRRYVEIILRESKKLRDLIDEILTFSEIEEDKFSPIVSEIDLVEKLREIINMKTEEASAKGLKIIFLNKVGTNDIVIGDSLSLVKIFEQLISNAIKFTEKGKIEVAIAEKKEEENSILYYFYIKDTGIGIEKDQIDKIFEPFYQLDPILTRRFGGLGLGLTLVKRLIEYMGGHIWIDSTPGQGTTYNFTLKFKKPS